VEKRYLLIVRAGDTSLHPNWLKGGPRRWDLHISYFGTMPQPFGALAEGVTLSHDPGPKYLGLAACFTAHPEFLDHYPMIGLADDDLLCDGSAWNATFAILDEIGADLGQPSLDPRSFFSYDMVLQRHWLKYREVDFIEVMCPIFSANFLRAVLPTFTLNRSSWGIDYLWREQARREGRRLAIVDAVSVLHTRAIGGGTQYSAANLGKATPLDDYRTAIERAGITDTERRTLRAVRRDGREERSLWRAHRHLRLAGLRRKWRTALGTRSVLPGTVETAPAT